MLQNILTSTLATLNSVPADVWLVLIETVGAALVASPVVVGIKKWLDIHSDKVMLITTIGASMFAAAGAYVVNDPVFSAWLLPVHGWLIFATTQPVYFYLIKPIMRRVQALIAEAVAFNAEIKSAAVPPSGLPVSSGKPFGE